MFIKFLGIVDLLAAAILLLSGVLPSEWVMIMAFYLLIKGGFFLLTGDWMSILDVGAAVYFMFVASGWTTAIITALVVLFLLQKGAFSLLT